MEPIRATREAIDELEPFAADTDLLERLRDMGRQVRAIVPDSVGLSLASKQHGVTFTLVASQIEIAVFDALQYLAGGPCEDSVRDGRIVAYSHADPLHEDSWRMFAQATAGAGVVSTLTLPIIVDDEVAGSVNLYGGSARAFVGHHEELAEIFSAWAPGAVSNADLSFSTRRQAEQAPGLLRDGIKVNTAVGVIAAIRDIDVNDARRLLARAAERAGITVVRLAEVVVALTRGDAED